MTKSRKSHKFKIFSIAISFCMVIFPLSGSAEPTDVNLKQALLQSGSLKNYEIRDFVVLIRDSVGSKANRTYEARFKATVRLVSPLYKLDRRERNIKKIRFNFVSLTHKKNQKQIYTD